MQSATEVFMNSQAAYSTAGGLR